ncbi:phage terminase small subunit [Natribacillus halophilus]|uniref:Phage terminase small subunit n=2 Tax=Natribacillus halophilus TaxID=549003 RepID=A0A1G8RT09_9BACI|nr:phage terminase small subunit [Natribacillus halophilus]
MLCDMAKLTEKQRRFADEYIRLGEITQAAINAGYSTKTAHATGNENLKKPIVKTYIDERLEKLRKESIAEQDEILQYLTSVMRGNVNDEHLMVTGDDMGTMVEKHERRSDTMARTKAAELLGKRHMMWTEKHQVEDVTPILVEDVPDDDS